MNAKTILMTGTALIFLAIGLGAFGAHGLKNMLDEKSLHTFTTGVDYQFYHGFGLLFMGLLKKQKPDFKTHFAFIFMVAGVILFSFNCYFYAVSGIKFFAMIVPLGGISFLVAWGLMFLNLRRFE